MTLVVDTSVALAWCFEDEMTPSTEDVLEPLRRTSAFVPSLWTIEFANILLVGERRGRLTAARTAAFLHSLEALPITVDHTTASRARGPILDLARAQRLTAYDACYLDLALHLSLPIATQDSKLRAAAAHVGVAFVS